MRDGTIYNSHTVTLYTQWTVLCTNLQLNHLLEDPNLPSVDILQVYGHWARHGNYSSQYNRLKADLLAMAWRAIAETHLKEGLSDSRKLHSSHAKELEKCLTRMLRNFSYQALP